jgi:aspartate/methionine/tyrosine aminotransferase
MKIAQRASVDPFYAMEVLKAANEREASGGDVLHMEVGQPGAGVPDAVIQAAHQALAENRIGYTDALGIPDLRARISRHYHDYYGLDVSPERIAVTTGSSGGFLLSFLAAFDAGDRVAMGQPGYPAYRNILRAYGIEPVMVDVGKDSHFQPTPAHLEEIGPLDGLIVASPANPTGSMLDRAALEALSKYCSDRGIRLISDEIYHGITYGGPAPSALEFGGKAIVVNSFSKYYCMTGWRLGWLVLPNDLVRPIELLAQSLFISAPALSQAAGLAAFDCSEEFDHNVAQYARNRERLLTELPSIGFTEFAPADGAFYVYADVSGFSNDSSDFCRRMLAETGVATTPGIDFDQANGHRYVRFSFAGSGETVDRAIARLKDWLG